MTMEVGWGWASRDSRSRGGYAAAPPAHPLDPPGEPRVDERRDGLRRVGRCRDALHDQGQAVQRTALGRHEPGPGARPEPGHGGEIRRRYRPGAPVVGERRHRTVPAGSPPEPGLVRPPAGTPD